MRILILTTDSPGFPHQLYCDNSGLEKADCAAQPAMTALSGGVSVTGSLPYAETFLCEKKS
jgi:hypothetical protein